MIFPFPMEENKNGDLIVLLESKQYAKAHAWLNRTAPAELEGADLGQCLMSALRATPSLFRKVLLRCPQQEYSGKVLLRPKDGTRAYVSGTLLTLAAAVACGSREAAAVLLRCPSVWKAESGGVCRAAVSALQMFPDDPRQAVAGMVFGKLRRGSFDAQTLIHTCDLQIEYAADFCPYDLLETQIRCGFLHAEGARRILKTFEETALCSHSAVRARIRKMSLLAKTFPEVCREPWAAGLFLRELVRRRIKGQPYRRLKEQWLHLCGGEGDLTWAQVELYRLSRAELRALLEELGQETRLVMDADGLSCFGREARGELMELLTHAELRHNTGLEGVSALAENLIRIGDLRYLRKAAQLGAFAGEDPGALMQYLGQSEKNNLRPLVLAYGGEKSTQEPRWKQECRRRQWNRCWHIGRKAYTDWLAELTQEELPEEECLRRLQVMHYGAPAADFWRQDCSIPVKLPDASHRQEVMTAHAEAAVICGEQTRPLKLMLRFMPEALERRYELEFHDRSLLNLEGTPLALAAAAGRTEAVRVLLNAGFDPDETGRGLLSSLRWFGTNAFPVTPVMAAIYYGEEETARLLLEAGAVCDFSKPLFRALLERGDAHTMETAKALPDTGFDRIPQAWLDALEEKKQLFQTLF